MLQSVLFNLRNNVDSPQANTVVSEQTATTTKATTEDLYALLHSFKTNPTDADEEITPAETHQVLESFSEIDTSDSGSNSAQDDNEPTAKEIKTQQQMNLLQSF